MYGQDSINATNPEVHLLPSIGTRVGLESSGSADDFHMASAIALEQFPDLLKRVPVADDVRTMYTET